MRVLSVAVAFAGVLAPAYASAATVSFSANVPGGTLPWVPPTYTFTLSAFDTHLGTLTGVKLEIDSATSASATVRNISSSSRSFVGANTSVPLTVTGVDGVSASAIYDTPLYSGSVAGGSIHSPTLWTSPTTSGSASGSKDVAAANFGDYESSHALLLTFTADTTGYKTSGSGAVFFGGTATTSGTFKITYTYTAVPEVSTWAMMGLGFAGLGFAGFRANRKGARLAV